MSKSAKCTKVRFLLATLTCVSAMLVVIVLCLKRLRHYCECSLAKMALSQWISSKSLLTECDSDVIINTLSPERVGSLIPASQQG